MLLLSLLQFPDSEEYVQLIAKDCFGRVQELLSSLEVDPTKLKEGQGSLNKQTKKKKKKKEKKKKQQNLL